MSTTELTIPRVLDAIALVAGISPTDIIGQRRVEEFVIARHLLCHVLRHHMGLGVRETARELGRPVSSVAYSCQQIEWLLRYDRRTQRMYTDVVIMLVFVNRSLTSQDNS